MLNFDPFTILWTLIDLLILFLLMKKFLFKPVNDILQSRASAIEEAQKQAEKDRTEAEELRKRYEAELSASRSEAAELLGQAKTQSQELYQKTVADAQAEAKKILAAGAERNRYDREVMLKSLREEMASLVTEAAAKAAENNENAIDEFLKEECESK